MKAIPRPSVKYGEVVCCAGVTLDRQWRRLFPVRFRMLRENKFDRWQWVSYRSRGPRADKRAESRHVYEDTITPKHKMKESERPDFLQPLIMPSAKEAAENGHSLALVRPQNVRFTWRKKDDRTLERERNEMQKAVRQGELWDEELKAFQPTPYHFLLRFKDQNGWHNHTCGDWETVATLYRQSRKYSEDAALQHLNKMYNQQYPDKGMALALGTMAKKPKIWLLLGVIRLDPPTSAGDLFL